MYNADYNNIFNPLYINLCNYKTHEIINPNVKMSPMEEQYQEYIKDLNESEPYKGRNIII